MCSHSGCVCHHSGYVLCVIEGNPLLTWGLKSCFPLVDIVVECAHTVVVCANTGGTPNEHGAIKVVFQ